MSCNQVGFAASLRAVARNLAPGRVRHNTEHGVTMTRTTQRLSPDAEGLSRATRLLRGGGIVAMPTETVYGLAADARQADAVARIYAAKGRPAFNPLIVHVSDLSAAQAIGVLSQTALDLAQAFWPGPCTLVVPARANSGIASLVTAGLDTIALRVPSLPIARALLTEFDGPLAAPSANRSGQLSPTRPDHVIAQLDGAVDAVVNGPACPVGIESTILGVTGDSVSLLRPGSVTPDQVAQVTGVLPSLRKSGDPVSAPGQIASHYAPEARLLLNVTGSSADAIHIGFGAIDGDFNLSKTGDLAQACARLFDILHAADALAAARGLAISVAPLPDSGLGLALTDRLSRAAAPR